MRMRALAATLGAVALVVASAGAASAEANGTPVTNPANNLVLGGPYHGADNSPSDCGSIKWTDVGNNGDDSPIDSNDRALVADICAGDFAEVYTQKSLILNKPVGNLLNVSFDYQTNTVTGAGEIYILVVTTEGNYLYLDPFYCNSPLGGGAWSRADFTGATTGCSFYDANGVQYAADGTSSALDVYQAAHPNDTASLSDFVFSASATVDRIALGTDRLYNFTNVRAKHCQSNENRC